MFKFINKYIIILLGFYILWLGLVPLVLTEGVKVLSKNFSHNSEYKIVIEKPKVILSVLPVLTFKSDKLLLKSSKSKNEIDFNNFSVRIRLLPLISGKIHINDLYANDVNLIAEFKNEIHLDKNFFKEIETSKIIIDSIIVDKYASYIYQRSTQKPIKYLGENFCFQKKNGYVKFKLNGSFIANDKKSNAKLDLYIPKNNDIKKTVFDIEIANLDIMPFKIYFKNFLPSDLKDLNGIITVQANKDELLMELKDCSAIMNDTAKSIILPKIVTLKSRFNIKRQSIELESFDINSENIHLAIDGKISDYFGKSMPTFDLHVRIDKSRLEDFIKTLPAIELEELNLYKLKKYNLYGDVLSNFSIKGRMPEPDINGDIYINKAHFEKKQSTSNSGAVIKLMLSGRNFDFDVTVPTSKTEKVFVKGTQEIYNIKFADFTVKSTESVDLFTAQNILNPLHEILNFIIGPLPIMDVHGKGNIDILVKGNRKNPHVWGVLKFKKATAKFLDIPDLVLKNADATINFTDQNAVFANETGLLDDKELKITGYCDLFGKFDFDIKSQDLSTALLYNVVYNSKMLEKLQKLLPKFNKIYGLADIDLKIFGDVKSLEELGLNKNVFAKGLLKLKNNSFSYQNITIDKTSGNINFDVNTANADLNINIGEFPINIQAKTKNEIAEINLDIPKLNPNYLINDIELRSKQYLPIVSVNGKYKGSVETPDFNNLNFKAKVVSSIPSSSIKYKSGEINFSNGNTSVKNLNGYIGDTKNIFQANINGNSVFREKPLYSGNFKLKTPDLSLLNDIFTSDVLPKNIRNYLRNYQFTNGAIDLDCKIFNNNINVSSDLTGITFIYTPLELSVNIINGSLSVKNNILRFNKINMLADKMPILLDGDIRDIFGKQNFNFYLNSKPQQDFIDKYINKNQIYPIKIKGDIVYWAKLKGIKDNYELKSNIDLSKDASIYYYGASVGDVENAIEVDLDSRIIDNKRLKIREFLYDKVIESQTGRQTRLNMLKASGDIEILPDDLGFENLKIKTSNPTDARIFNIIFRKPNIKQGQFTSDLKFNGKLSNPKVIGDFHIFETNIPFFDTTMKNIELVFKDKIVEIISKGEVMGNDVSFEGVLKNKLSVPYHLEKGVLYTKNLDLNKIVEKLKLSEVDNVSTFDSLEGFKLSSFTFNNLKFKADSIQLRNIYATEYEAIANLNSKGVFEINNFKFNIADGTLNGKFGYNLKNNDMQINLVADSINANDISWALFDLRNQIYGDLTGTINLSCNGTNFNSCMQTLNGDSIFNVKDGNMPKLGSLEYLLKASNLVKGGITGLSINSVIDLISPLKLGEFSDIYGSVNIKDGITQNLEIATKGKDLSLFMSGTYNFATSIADMEILGLLSRKISTMFGPLGNMSINTLFNVIPGVNLEKDSPVLERINKIPGIELSSKAYRKFIADIKGNINGDNYVTSFKWIN